MLWKARTKNGRTTHSGVSFVEKSAKNVFFRFLTQINEFYSFFTLKTEENLFKVSF